jgi:hypothetical protein
VEQVAAGLSSITSPYQPFGKVGHHRPQFGNVAERFGDLFKRRKPCSIQNSVSATVTSGLSFSCLVAPFGSLQVDSCCILAGETFFGLLFVS